MMAVQSRHVSNGLQQDQGQDGDETADDWGSSRPHSEIVATSGKIRIGIEDQVVPNIAKQTE